MKNPTIILAAFLACVPASAQTTRPVRYVGVYSQKASDLAFWASKGINLSVHWESESGKVTQRQHRAAVKAAGLKYIDTYLEDADADDPDLIGWILKDSDEWNRARGNPPFRPDPAPFVAESVKLATLNRAKGTTKLIMANADGPGVTTALFEKPPYNGVKNGETALMSFINLRSIDWYPVVLTASTQPSEIARRPMYLPAQAVWRIKTWGDFYGWGPSQHMAIVEAAKNWKAPLGVTPAQMREQVDYLMGAKPFPVPDANGKPVNFQGQLIDILVWWTANGQDGPGWKWIASDADQMAALVEITAKLRGVTPPPVTQPTTVPTTAPSPDLIALQAKVEEQARAIQTVQDRQKSLDDTLDRLRDVLNTRAPPVTQPTTKPLSRVYFETNVTPIAGWFNPKWTDDGKGSFTDKSGEYQWIVNPDWHAYAYGKGYTPYAMVYSGTINRAFAWADDDGNPRPMTTTNGGGQGLDWTRTINRNNEDPLNLAAVRAIAKCAAKPGTYGVPGPPRIIVFDLEAVDALKGHGMFPPATAPTAVRRAAAQRWLDAVRVCRAEGVGVGIFFGPPWWPDKADSWDLEVQLLAELDSCWVNMYTTDDTADPAVWRAQLDRVAALMAAKAPKTRVVALMSPWWQISTKAGQPIDLERWRWQAREVRARPGWEIGLWVEGGPLDKAKGYLDAVADVSNQ